MPSALLYECVCISAREYPPLRESIDPKLQAAFERTLDKAFGKEFWDLVKAKKVGIVVADITDPYKPKAEIYRKSGTWRQFHSDSGVIVHEDKEYIIVALVEHPEGGQGLAELIIAVDELMDNMSAQ